MSSVNADIVLPPTGTSSVAVTSTSTAATPLSGNGYFAFKATGNTAFIIFGRADVDEASTSNGWPISDGETIHRYISDAITHFRVVTPTTATLYWARS